MLIRVDGCHICLAAGPNHQDVLGGNGLLPEAWSYSEGTYRAVNMFGLCLNPLPKRFEIVSELEAVEVVELPVANFFM